MNESLRSIKSENVKAVFNAVAEGGRVSRASISEKIGLSLVSVGKIVEALICENVFLEEKRINEGAGRRAGILRINTDKFVTVIRKKEKETSIGFFSLEMREIGRVELKSDESFDDALAECAMTVLNIYGAENCIGVGIISDNTDEWDDVVKQTQAFFPDKNIKIDSPIRAATLATMEYLDKDELGMYVYMNGGEVRGAFVMNNGLVPNQDGYSADFGGIRMNNGIHVSDILSRAEDMEQTAQIITGFTYNISRVVHMRASVFEVKGSYDLTKLFARVNELLDESYLNSEEEKPKVIYMNDANGVDYCNRGIIMNLRDRWLDNAIMNVRSRNRSMNT